MNVFNNSCFGGRCVSKPQHDHSKEESKFNNLMVVVEKISAVALGIFSFYTNSQLFIPFFLTGVCVGIYSYSKGKQSCEKHHRMSSCAHGLLEELTGTKLPPIISTIANIAVTVCHIDHHANVFVPIVGISLGNWMGKAASHYGEIACKKITAHFSKKPVFSS